MDDLKIKIAIKIFPTAGTTQRNSRTVQEFIKHDKVEVNE